MKVIRPALRYHGGKWMLAPWICRHFPEHRVYTEPFGGAASVLLRKPRAKLVEIYNELDPEMIGAIGNTVCTCPSGDGSLRWPCPRHPPEVA
ncbi:DNA adenine methylase [Chromobacterium sp. CV08]|uniref:DNA adenine methylase n=1 Tax=Chromobacterium sp. CV08 TaxID=3133274 RepID=UPI003DA8EA0C